MRYTGDIAVLRVHIMLSDTSDGQHVLRGVDAVPQTDVVASNDVDGGSMEICL